MINILHEKKGGLFNFSNDVIVEEVAPETLCGISMANSRPMVCMMPIAKSLEKNKDTLQDLPALPGQEGDSRTAWAYC